MGLFKTSKRTLVVGVDAILKSKGGRDQNGPRQQLQMLRALSRVAQREKVNITAVIAGKPLNKAPHNKLFDGIRVRYAKTADQTASELIRSLKQAGSAGVLVTEDIALEKKALRSGTDTLRTSTFRKLLDDSADAGGGQNSGGNRDRSNKFKRKNHGRDRKPRAENKKQRPAKENKRKQEKDEISQMIDLID